tara:strand:+ start:67 stop:213 length:147 start_codon:yes stop_codon:yes gene_type:complete
MNIEDAVIELIKKTKEAEKSEDALRFSQSVANLSHAKSVDYYIGKDNS